MPKAKSKPLKAKSKAKTKTTKTKTSAKKKLLKLTAKKTTQKSTKKTKAVRKTKVSAIPSNFNTVTPYLIVEGAHKAIEFYKQHFGAKLTGLLEHEGKVAHSQLKIGNTVFMLGDACPERNSYGPSADVPPPISLYIYVKDVDATINQAAAAGANISRPAQDMFYGDRTGMITDPFGHQWCIATHFEDVSKAELKKRHAAMMQNFKNNPSIEVQQKFEDAELENTGEFERD